MPDNYFDDIGIGFPLILDDLFLTGTRNSLLSAREILH
jgi:hypothetical protein